MPPFHYFDKATWLSSAALAAVANVFGLHVWGLPAWLIWLFIHNVHCLVQSRVLVFINGDFEYLTFNRGARLITGTGEGDVHGPPPRDAPKC